VAEILLVHHRISGDVVREIMKKHIPASLYVSDADQKTIDEGIHQRGGVAIDEWLSRFNEKEEEQAA